MAALGGIVPRTLRNQPDGSLDLSEVESAIRSGAYRPSASQLANKLLDAAEIDAKLQAMLRA